MDAIIYTLRCKTVNFPYTYFVMYTVFSKFLRTTMNEEAVATGQPRGLAWTQNRFHVPSTGQHHLPSSQYTIPLVKICLFCQAVLYLSCPKLNHPWQTFEQMGHCYWPFYQSPSLSKRGDVALEDCPKQCNGGRGLLQCAEIRRYCRLLCENSPRAMRGSLCST